MLKRHETIPNGLEVAQPEHMPGHANYRISGFYKEFGFKYMPITHGPRGVTVFPPGYADSSGSNLFYWMVDGVSDPEAWSYHSEHDKLGLPSRWAQGEGKALDPRDDMEESLQARIVVPSVLDVVAIYDRARESSVGRHVLTDVRTAPQSEAAYFDFMDPFFNRVAVVERVPEH